MEPASKEKPVLGAPEERLPGPRPLRAILGAAVVAAHGAPVFGSLAIPLWLLVQTFRVDGAWTLTAWQSAFGDLGRWASLLANSITAVLVSLVLSLVLGGTLAFLLFRTDAFLRRVAIALLLFAAAVPVYVTSTVVIGIIGVAALRESALALGCVHGIAHTPVAALIVGVALLATPKDLEEAALTEGAGQLRAALLVSLRAARPGFVAAAVLVVLWVTTDYSAADILQVRTFAEETYTQFALHGRSQGATLASLPQIFLLGIFLWLLRGHFLTAEGSLEREHATRRYTLGRWRAPLSVLGLASSLAVAVAPIALLGSWLEGDKGIFYFAHLFRREMFTSLWTSLAAGALSAAVGVGLAWYLVRLRRWRWVLSAYVVVVLATPAPVLGIGLIRLFNVWLGAIYDSPVILVVAYTLRFLPVAVILLVPAVRAIPKACEMAAAVDGASALDVWWRVIHPLCLPTTLIALFLVVILALGELPCSLLVTPPGYWTVGTTYFNLVHYSRQADAAALCLLALALVFTSWIVLVLLLRKRLMR